MTITLRRWTALLLATGTLALAGPREAFALPGDVNGDGVVDETDAQWVLEFVVGTRALTPAERAAADVNGDGKVDVADAQLIRRLVAAKATAR